MENEEREVVPPSTYRETLRYLYSFVDYEKQAGGGSVRLGLEPIQGLLRGLGRPERGWPSVHIAGTKGKGSTAALIASIARHSGYRVGLYTSPHLITFRERIVVDGTPISKEETCRLVDRLRPVVDEVTRGSASPPTFFDVWTALAFLYFAERRVDLAVVEVGLGGRLDSTNVVTPLVSVITPLGLDHTDRLGTTLRAIAGEKAGIIKEGVPTVTSPQEPDALTVIRDTCRARRSPLRQVGREIQFTVHRSDSTGQAFDVSGRRGRYPNLETRLLGAYQVVNAATAIGAVEELNERGMEMPLRGVEEGLRTVEWPGRLQVAQERPWLILDGAHNVLSARTLVQEVRRLFPYRRAILVVSVSRDKDVPGVCAELAVLADVVIVTGRRVVRTRQADPDEVAGWFRVAGKDVSVAPDVLSALELARALASPDDLICITGSFYLVGEVMEGLQHLEPEEMWSR
ncbi:MAG: bifunctional folylpolyglutamate synthase/dihydrofolate synthase [Candidatus Latescibacteria bacterium]|nr:bifunctional folylpolyglutamate synthase/dihydrofolate synthase [Candidatus Latescibacterota bacterium]